MRLRNAFKNSVFEASKLVTTKTLLLKHYYRHQGFLGGRFDLFYFFCSGEGKGESGATGRGRGWAVLLLKTSGRGGGSPTRGARRPGAGRVSAEILGGGG